VNNLFKIILSLLLCQTSLLYADALMVNQSAKASTIIEFYIDEQGVRAELEIGLDSVEGFKNILPDAIYQQLGYGQEALAQRQQHFFKQQLALLGPGNTPLNGEVLSIGPSRKVLRDIISGVALPIQDEAPDIIRASLLYRFEPGPVPDQLVFLAPTRSIGFIAYHNGVAVNDFRYLASGYTLQLDWQDPWYSRFKTRNLRRQYFAPMSGFIYVEPFEVRKEIIARPKDLQRWLDLGLEGKTTIPVDMQAGIKEKVAAFLAEHQPITINGEASTGILDSINFLKRTLTSSRVIDPPEPLQLDAAIIGAIFVYPQQGLPKTVTMDWDLWDDRIQRVPVSAVDQAGPLPSFLDPSWRLLEWENFLTNPIVPTLMAIDSPTPQWQALLAKSLPLLAVLVLLSLWWLSQAIKSKQSKGLATVVSILVLALCLAAIVLGKSSKPDPEQARAIVSNLLHNIYRAFDYRDESDIYDTLSRSVNGELLTDIFLETKRSLVLANQGGARAKVKNVLLDGIELKANDTDNSFTVIADWTVNGSVGHWGHIHQRSNRYQALFSITVDEQQWKLQTMTVLQEERL
jgi:hypothetical protein